ncbi:MAG: hypothetical protein M1831_002543 [Alyxoria varia]|nr:MAG: hypothetical protein M1831_002543 [Alyxoria varia]
METKRAPEVAGFLSDSVTPTKNELNSDTTHEMHSSHPRAEGGEQQSITGSAKSSRTAHDEDSNHRGRSFNKDAQDKDIEKGRSSRDSSSHHEKEAAKNDPNIVDWDGPDDPANPMNWSKSRKWSVVWLASALTFITPLASSMFAPGVPELMAEFGSDSTLLASFVVSVYLLGFVFGPLVMAPASEVYGRTPVYHAGNLLFVVFSIACAVATDLPMFCVFRFIQGTAGATPLTNGGASIGDVIPVEQRGAAMAIWALGPLAGPVVGPVIGGFLSQAKGWRWVFWLLTIVGGTLAVTSVFLLRETYAPVILERKAARLRKETGNQNLRSKLDEGLPPREFFRRAVVRPTKLLFLSPIVFLLTLNVSIVFGYLYLLFTTFTYVFEAQYGFTTGTAGLTYLGAGIGMFVGLGIVGRASDAILKKKAAQEPDGKAKPEHRLPPLVFGPVLIAAGLFGYGWTVEKGVHWSAPIILTSLIGVGMIVTFMPTMTYLIDAFGRYSASASAANNSFRCLVGAVLPLAGQPMYDSLGLGWGNSLLAFIALAMIPIPFLFLRYGERIRTSPRFQIKL